MAVIKLGAIVTGIAGSIGGTTFRRTREGLSAMNKSGGPSRNRARQNSILNTLRARIQAWTDLTPITRGDWNDAAPLFQFPDKFGDLKTLTGRQLFIKLSTRAQLIEEPIPDPNSLDAVIPFINSASFTIGVLAGVPQGNIAVQAQDPLFFVFGFQRVRSTTFSPDLAKFVIGGFIHYTQSGGTNQNFIVDAQVAAQLGDLTVGEFVALIMWPQNADGFRAAAITSIEQVQEI